MSGIAICDAVEQDRSFRMAWGNETRLPQIKRMMLRFNIQDAHVFLRSGEFEIHERITTPCLHVTMSAIRLQV